MIASATFLNSKNISSIRIGDFFSEFTCLISIFGIYHKYMQKWNVRLKPKVSKKLHKLPADIPDILAFLVADLQTRGFNPGKRWRNFSSIGQDKYHCHLTYRYVACWEVLDEKIELMEVYYVGSREKAPY
jgi:mRNA-degrading endonuclease RelE of RelBE toxin-antitoxin system